MVGVHHHLTVQHPFLKLVPQHIFPDCCHLPPAAPPFASSLLSSKSWNIPKCSDTPKIQIICWRCKLCSLWGFRWGCFCSLAWPRSPTRIQPKNISTLSEDTRHHHSPSYNQNHWGCTELSPCKNFLITPRNQPQGPKFDG